MSFNINNQTGMHEFYSYLETTKGLPYFKEQEEGVLIPVSFEEFHTLSETHKNQVYERLQGAMSELSAESPVRGKIQECANLVFYELNKPEEKVKIPKDTDGLIQTNLTPKEIGTSTQVSKTMEQAGKIALMHNINQGLKVRDALPPHIKTVVQAIEWLTRNMPENMTLVSADFRGFNDFDEGHLKTLFETFPNIKHLSFTSEHITKIEALPKGLLTLNCSSCKKLTQLPELPKDLQILNCSVCWGLTELPELPAKLIEFNCDSCKKLEKLPALPDDLIKLFCGSCPITAIPKLPNKLEMLQCFNLKIINLPELPPMLRMLQCGSCPKLIAIPTLPEALEFFSCQTCNAIKQIPSLPAGLLEFNCNDCYFLNSFPAFPDGLQKLVCGGGEIEIPLDNLPNSLQSLSCSSYRTINPLPNKLPDALHTLKLIQCRQIHDLPTLPGTLRMFELSGSPIVHLPELPKDLIDLKCYGPNLDEESKIIIKSFQGRRGG